MYYKKKNSIKHQQVDSRINSFNNDVLTQRKSIEFYNPSKAQPEFFSEPHFKRSIRMEYEIQQESDEAFDSNGTVNE